CQAEDGIRVFHVTGVQTCALPILALNIFPEHLDWHGSHERYVADKLRLLTGARPGIAVLNATDPVLSRLVLPESELRWFNREDEIGRSSCRESVRGSAAAG